MVAAIRHDQPWVERSIPKVGEHEMELPTTVGRAGAAMSEAAPAGSRELVERSPAAVAVPEMTRRVHLRALSHVAVQIADLPRAERFYAEFLNMELVGRARRGARGEFEAVNGDYRWDEAMRDGTPADVSFMRNGPVMLALQRVGRGARIERGVVDHIAVGVDATTFATLKAEALVRPLTVLASTDTTFTFRDPFGLVWELMIEGSVSPYSR
jgi:catechol 2,3-dioxygenase-like lactoylglutathione lyase family enzyme